MQEFRFKNEGLYPAGTVRILTATAKKVRTGTAKTFWQWGNVFLSVREGGRDPSGHLTKDR